jgi:hypothetical protein
MAAEEIGQRFCEKTARSGPVNGEEVMSQFMKQRRPQVDERRIAGQR